MDSHGIFGTWTFSRHATGKLGRYSGSIFAVGQPRVGMPSPLSKSRAHAALFSRTTNFGLSAAISFSDQRSCPVGLSRNLLQWASRCRSRLCNSVVRPSLNRRDNSESVVFSVKREGRGRDTTATRTPSAATTPMEADLLTFGLNARCCQSTPEAQSRSCRWQRRCP
jgi:hypothetical protein